MPFNSTKRSLSLIILTFIILAIAFMGLIQIKTNFTYRSWFSESDPALIAYDKSEALFGNSDSVIFTLSHSEGMLKSQQNLAAINMATNDILSIKDIIRVDSLSHSMRVSTRVEEPDQVEISPYLKVSDEEVVSLDQAVFEDVNIENYLISSDKRSIAIYGYLRPFINEKPQYMETFKAIKKLQNKYEQQGFEVHISGSAIINASFADTTNKDLAIIIPLLFLLIVVFSFILFRNLKFCLLLLFHISLTTLVTLGFGGFLGVELSLITSMLPNILIVVCVADNIHLFSKYGHSLSTDNNYRTSIINAARNIFKPTLLTSVSTSIGFFSLALSDIVPVYGLGILAGIGTLVAWFFTYTFTAPLLYLFSSIRPKKMALNKSIFNLFNRVYRKPMLVTFSFIVLAIVGLFIAFNNEINTDTLGYFKENTSIRQDSIFIDQNFGGVGGLDLLIDSGETSGIYSTEFLKNVEAYLSWISSLDKVTKVNSLLDSVKEVNLVMNGEKSIPPNREQVVEGVFFLSLSLPENQDLFFWYDQSERYLRVKITWLGIGSKRNLVRINMVSEKASDFNLSASPFGKTVLITGMDVYIVKSFFKSMSIALIVITFLLMFVYRSILIGLLAILPNVLPIIFGFAAMSLLNINVDISSILIACVCLGICVDDTIFFLDDISKRLNTGEDLFLSIEKTVKRTGSTLAYTTVVLVGGFSSFLLSSFSPNSNFGLITIFILISALITDLLLLPCLLILFKMYKAHISIMK